MKFYHYEESSREYDWHKLDPDKEIERFWATPHKTSGHAGDEAIRNGFDPVEDVIEDITRASYYPDNKPIWIKVIADRNSGRVLGSQIVGGEGVKERIDLISLALLLKAARR